MSAIIEKMKGLPKLYPLKAATTEEISSAEKELKTAFSEEYKEYLATFGAILADGVELSGIAKSEHRNVVSLTKQERELNPSVPHSMYVIENTGVDGMIIWQDSDGMIYKTQPNAPPERIAGSLAEYL
ncbi:MAG: SMI1/KNR4 family protein [Defluviitaleaceae bacterium]|nr:SMI1/KNR4 family protein [Defluviitaleaceae bacterium]